MAEVLRALIVSSMALMVLKVFGISEVPLALIVLPVAMVILSAVTSAPDDVEAGWRSRPVSVTRGKEFSIGLEVTVRKGIGVGMLRLIVPEELEVVSGKTTVVFFKWPWKKRLTVNVRMRPLRMGRYLLQAPEFISTGLLVAEWRTFNVGKPLTITVVPEDKGKPRRDLKRQVPLVKTPESPGAPLGPISLEFKEIREYRGDPMKLVNWKATARRGRLLVNEYEREGELAAMVYVDNRKGALEEVAFLVSQLSEHLSRVGYYVGIYVIGTGKLLPPSPHPKRVYELALTPPSSDESLSQVLRRSKKTLISWKPLVIMLTKDDAEVFDELAGWISGVRRVLPRSPMLLVDVCMGELEALENSYRDLKLDVPSFLWNVYDLSPIMVSSILEARLGARRWYS